MTSCAPHFGLGSDVIEGTMLTSSRHWDDAGKTTSATEKLMKEIDESAASWTCRRLSEDADPITVRDWVTRVRTGGMRECWVHGLMPFCVGVWPVLRVGCQL